uniref:Uncharacterized protein n=1 Tax=Tanacetum cinerariifolium TaxID=118510 RepID=A0A699I2L5_TANCI|nr:hypothetical protein [Tanacetum cinerariifolium]
MAKNTLPQALTNAVRETLPGFNQRIKNAIKEEMPKVLQESILKPMKCLGLKDKTSADLHELVDLVSQLINIMDSIVPSFKASVEMEKESQKQPESTTAVDTQALKSLHCQKVADLKDEREKFEKKIKRVLKPKQLRAQEEELAKIKKRNRKAKVLHEVFVKENIVMDGMQRNLSLPVGVVGKSRLVIKEPEARIFLYNGFFDLFFQRRSGYHLASTS